MKQSSARLFLFIALICSSLSLIFTSISYSIPRWKFVSLPTNFSFSHPLDPLIRSELEKYLRHLYQPGEIHSIGLTRHCLSTGQCGENSLPTFDLSEFARCQNIHYHRQCLFFQRTIDSDEQCRCETPVYIHLIRTLMISLLICQGFSFLFNIIRLARQKYQLDFLDDIKLRLVTLVSSFLSSIFPLIIIIQTNLHRFDEPLEFFQMMFRHYSHLQINSFTRDIQIIIEDLEKHFHFHFGFCYIIMFFVWIFSFISFVCSSTVEIKIDHLLPSLSDQDKFDDYYQNPPTLREHYPRQTKV